MKKLHLILVGAVGLAVGCHAWADILDRPSGIKIGERMTLRPYVSTSLTYDSNVGGRGDDGKEDCLWTVSPTLGLTYDAGNWSLLLSAFYNYRMYFEDRYKSNRHEYGQDLRWQWSNSSGGEKGWSLVLGESFRQITKADDLTLSDGTRYAGDYRQLQVSGAVQRRINEQWHGDVNASYYWLDYMDSGNSQRSYCYGWDRWTVGAEAGFAPSKWTDILLSGSYQGYSQDNLSGSGYSGDSQGWSVQGGLGSYMTERISYRLLAGWSRFEYGDGLSTANGFVYTASGNWKIGETWNTMLLATSYYQPSERQYASKSRIDAVSWGLAKSMVRGKLRATLDLRYRRETNEYELSGSGNDWDYVLNVITGRIGLDYTLNRFLSTFAYVEYQRSMNDEASKRGDLYDYDRWRATVGVRLSY